MLTAQQYSFGKFYASKVGIPRRLEPFLGTRFRDCDRNRGQKICIVWSMITVGRGEGVEEECAGEWLLVLC